MNLRGAALLFVVAVGGLTVSNVCITVEVKRDLLGKEPASANDQEVTVSLDADSNTATPPQPHSPPPCGVYYYYHIGKNGGSSVLEWQDRHARAARPAIHSMRFLRIRNPGGSDKWLQGIEALDSLIVNKGLNNNNNTQQQNNNKRWISVHHHHRYPGLRYMMPILRHWRRELRRQGCDLVLTTTLREPVARLQSLVSFLKVAESDFGNFVQNFKESQVRYLLYNFCAANSHPAVPPTFCHGGAKMERVWPDSPEIDEALGYLQEFDIVERTENLGRFLAESEYKTGWGGGIPGANTNSFHSNKSVLGYNISAEMRQLMVDNVQEDLQLWERAVERQILRSADAHGDDTA